MRSGELLQHQGEIQANRMIWDQNPTVRLAYQELFKRIRQAIDFNLPGPTVEIGSGIGKLKEILPFVLLSDFVWNPWLDYVLDAYRLPFKEASLSHLILVDVFHHLEMPLCFLQEAHRVLQAQGRLILLEPYIGWIGWLVYGLCHREPIAWRQEINPASKASTGSASTRSGYYAAQGNATRLFFRGEAANAVSDRWRVIQREAFACFYYLLTGGFSGPTFYPSRCFPKVKKIDHFLSQWPRLFGARCLVVLERASASEKD